jgi:hypothetical protein
MLIKMVDQFFRVDDGGKFGDDYLRTMVLYSIS